jgi:hypothetical protein
MKLTYTSLRENDIPLTATGTALAWAGIVLLVPIALAYEALKLAAIAAVATAAGVYVLEHIETYRQLIGYFV